MSRRPSLPVSRGFSPSRVRRRSYRLLPKRAKETRIIGGAVRNALLGADFADLDLATTALPQRTIEIAEARGWKAVPTGIEHGTITLVIAGKPYEVTTCART